MHVARRVPSPTSPARSKALPWSLALLLVAILLPTPASSESDIVLPLPEAGGDMRATTFDVRGQAIGRSSFVLRPVEPGRHRMEIEMAVDGGGVNRSQALLATVADAAIEAGSRAATAGLRLLEERAQSTRADGTKLDLLVIDHARGRASCYPADDSELEHGRHIELPDDDRVVNVPMQLLFRPLVEGEVEDIRFQIVLCRDEPYVQDMIAVRGPRIERDGRRVIEVRYGPDLGRAVAWFASRLLPSFSFWFDEETGAYLGHRMPLHREGPEILLVRKGLAPLDLGID